MTIEHRQPHTIRAGEPRMELPPAPPWMTDTPCSKADPATFFPKMGGSSMEAKAICRTCPVRLACLRYALEHNIADGVWGGVGADGRRKMKHSGAAS